MVAAAEVVVRHSIPVVEGAALPILVEGTAANA